MGSFTGFPPSGYKNIALRMGGDEKGFRDFPVSYTHLTLPTT